MPEEDTTEVEETTEDATVEVDSSEALLHAVLRANGVDDVDDFLDNNVTFKRDGTPVITMPQKDAPPTAPQKKVTKRTVTPAAPRQNDPKPRVAPVVKVQPDPNANRNQMSANLADQLKQMSQEERAALLTNMKVTQ